MSKVNEKYPDLSTKRSQRIAIWIICIVMAVGFLASLFVWVLAIVKPESNPSNITSEKIIEKMQQDQAEQEAIANNYEVFGGYELTTFDAASVSELTVETLKEGDGEVVAATDSVDVYYTGWLPDGTIFDSTKSIDGENELRPGFSLNGGVIAGWTEGLAGQKVGGVYQLTIPAEKAYGSTGKKPTIPADTPLRFVVEIVSKTSGEM